MPVQAQITTVELYRKVVNDVVSNVRESLLDDGVDPDTIETLKSEWVRRLLEMGGPDLREQTQNVLPIRPAPRQPEIKPRDIKPPQIHSVAGHKNLANLQSTSQTYGSAPGPSGISLMHQQQNTYNPQLQSAIQASMSEQLGSMGSIGLDYSNSNIQTSSQGRFLQLTPEQLQMLQLQLQQQQDQNAAGGIPFHFASQMDGDNGIEPVNPDDFDGTNIINKKISGLRIPNFKPNLKKRCAVPKKPIQQVDGANGDSDEEEFEDDDDEDTAGNFDDEADLQNEDLHEAEPLNSEDDEPDEEESLFDTPNRVICQFEKVTRVRNKWKFQLVKGLIEAEGIDAAFDKANGEAEW